MYFVLGERCERAGVDPFVEPHDFRRTFVSNLLDAGATTSRACRGDLATVSKLASS